MALGLVYRNVHCVCVESMKIYTMAIITIITIMLEIYSTDLGEWFVLVALIGGL